MIKFSFNLEGVFDDSVDLIYIYKFDFLFKNYLFITNNKYEVTPKTT